LISVIDSLVSFLQFKKGIEIHINTVDLIFIIFFELGFCFQMAGNGLAISSSVQISLLFLFYSANLAKNPKLSVSARTQAIAYSYC